MHPRRLELATGIAVLAALLSLGCGEPDAVDEPPVKVLVLVADALRADALSCYGGGALTPNICSLAERGVLFERAYSNAPWTLPASVSMLTSRYASSVAGVGETREGSDSYYWIHEHDQLLAEQLEERGYDVHAFLENQLVAKSNSLQGYSPRKDDRILKLPSVHGPLLRDLGVTTRDDRYNQNLGLWYYLTKLSGDKFFILKWILDPHALYRPPPKFIDRIEVDPARLSRPLDFYQQLGNGKARGENLREHGPKMSEYELRYIEQLYWKEIESVDERVGHTLAALAQRGILESTVIVFTADHGEGFGEHGLFLHANSFYDELIHVPLLIAGPGIERGLRIPSAVSHVDLMPTLAELLAVEELPGAQGRSFAALLRGGSDPVADRVVYAVNPSKGGDVDALVQGNFKLVHWGDEAPQLYNLAADPREQRDLASERPEVVAAMQTRISALRRESAERKRQNLSKLDPEFLQRVGRETLEQLKSLGYVQ